VFRWSEQSNMRYSWRGSRKGRYGASENTVDTCSTTSLYVRGQSGRNRPKTLLTGTTRLRVRRPRIHSLRLSQCRIFLELVQIVRVFTLIYHSSWFAKDLLCWYKLYVGYQSSCCIFVLVLPSLFSCRKGFGVLVWAKIVAFFN
jgi:hypothetical protein